MVRYIAFAFLLSLTSYASLPGPAIWAGQWKGELYETVLWQGQYSTASWDPERDKWSMTAPQAIQAARVELKKLVGESHALMSVSEVKLVRYPPLIDDAKLPWYFLVTFVSERQAAGAVGNVSNGGLMIVILPFVVFPEGQVVAPVRKKPNKAPEPTPVSVTPRAIEGVSK